MITQKYAQWQIRAPDTMFSPSQWLPFEWYEWLPRWPRYAPNPFMLNHPTYFYKNTAWHTPYQVQFPHSRRHRMLKAVTTNKLKEVVAMIEEGFPLDQTVDPKYGYNALQLAAINNHFPLIQLLVMRGANINAPDQFGNTPLLLAVNNHSREAIHSLLRNGADPSIANKYGVTPGEKAKSESIRGFIEQFRPKEGGFPRFAVRLQLEERLNNPFWKKLGEWKMYRGEVKENPVNRWQFDFSDYDLVREL